MKTGALRLLKKKTELAISLCNIFLFGFLKSTVQLNTFIFSIELG
jgi:hypothetical protein